MNKEIERKFIVIKTEWDKLEKPIGVKLNQSYLSTLPNKTIRVRVFGKKGFVTFKGMMVGLTRPEFEYEIPLADAEEMIRVFEGKKIEKKRYHINYENHLWEVDVFEGENEGLIIAEIELKDENEDFKKPNWVGEEVSADAKYFNVNLQDNPFKSW